MQVVSSLENLVLVPLDLSYIFLLSPYHIVKEISLGSQFKTYQFAASKSGLFRKALCCLLSIFDLLSYLYVTKSVLPNESTNPTSHFHLTTAVFYAVQRLLLLKFLWSDQNKYLAFTCSLRNEQIDSSDPVWKFLQNEWVLRIICILVCIVVSPNAKLSKYYENEDFKWDIFSVMIGFGFVHGRLLGTYGHILPVFTVTVLWRIASNFSQFLLKSREQMNSNQIKNFAWQQIENQFEYISNLVEKVNGFLGHMITCFIVQTSLFFALELASIVTGNSRWSWITIWASCFTFCVFTVFLVLAADMNKKLGELKNWIYAAEKSKRLDKSWNVAVVLDQLNTNILAIKASNVFAITYGTVAIIMTTIATYFIICVQTRSSCNA